MTDAKAPEKMQGNASTEEPMLFEEKEDKKSTGWWRL